MQKHKGEQFKSSQKEKKENVNLFKSKELTPNIKKEMKGIIYLDNNATTAMIPEAIKIMSVWNSLPSNPSSSTKYGLLAKQMIAATRHAILQWCGINNEFDVKNENAIRDAKKRYVCLFTSGASESNCFILRGLAQLACKDRMPRHVIISSIEHKSILACAAELAGMRLLEVSYVTPRIDGRIWPNDITGLFKSNTALVCVMHANNESGVINDISEISRICAGKNVFYHSDCVQTFGKYRINIPHLGVTSISASLHKFGGPKGLGLLIIRGDLIAKLDGGQISGTQQFGLRGGTENVSGIAAIRPVLRNAFTNRIGKNKALVGLLNATLKDLSKYIPVIPYESFVEKIKKIDAQIIKEVMPKNIRLGLDQLKWYTEKGRFFCVILGALSSHLPNTLLISLCKLGGKPFCNVKLKKDLDAAGIIVSIGSACLTSSDKASHVIEAFAPIPEIRRGVIRISFGDQNKKAETRYLARELIKCIISQLPE